MQQERLKQLAASHQEDLTFMQEKQEESEARIGELLRTLEERNGQVANLQRETEVLQKRDAEKDLAREKERESEKEKAKELQLQREREREREREAAREDRERRGNEAVTEETLVRLREEFQRDREAAQEKELERETAREKERELERERAKQYELEKGKHENKEKELQKEIAKEREHAAAIQASYAGFQDKLNAAEKKHAEASAIVDKVCILSIFLINLFLFLLLLFVFCFNSFCCLCFCLFFLVLFKPNGVFLKLRAQEEAMMQTVQALVSQKESFLKEREEMVDIFRSLKDECRELGEGHSLLELASRLKKAFNSKAVEVQRLELGKGRLEREVDVLKKDLEVVGEEKKLLSTRLEGIERKQKEVIEEREAIMRERHTTESSIEALSAEQHKQKAAYEAKLAEAIAAHKRDSERHEKEVRDLQLALEVERRKGSTAAAQESAEEFSSCTNCFVLEQENRALQE